jgi:hypothetical protein
MLVQLMSNTHARIRLENAVQLSAMVRLAVIGAVCLEDHWN